MFRGSKKIFGMIESLIRCSLLQRTVPVGFRIKLAVMTIGGNPGIEDVIKGVEVKAVLAHVGDNPLAQVHVLEGKLRQIPGLVIMAVEASKPLLIGHPPKDSRGFRTGL